MRVNGCRFRVDIMSAVASRGALWFTVFPGKFTAKVMCTFLERLARQAGRKVHVIVDQCPVHRNKAVNHAEWRTRRHRKLLGEATEENTEYDRLHEEAELAHDLDQLVYDRRTALGLSQTEFAERCGMKQPQVSRIEGGGTVLTIPLLRRLARALETDLTILLTPHDQAA